MDQMQMLGDDGHRPWEDLPATALVIIFKKLHLKDRLVGGSAVCRSWQEASKNPQCWESMLHDGPAATAYNYSFEYLCIKQRGYIKFNASPFGRMKLTSKVVQTFVERSKGNATTIILHFANKKKAVSLLNFIISRCPKLKNLSMMCTNLFRIWHYEDVAGLVSLLDPCKELDLLDLAIPLDHYEETLRGQNPVRPLITNLSPKIRGLRVLCRGKTDWLQNDASVLFMNCRDIELLNISWTSLRSSNDLVWILDHFGNLKYLRVKFCHFRLDDELKEKCKRVAPTFPEFEHMPNLLVLIKKCIFLVVCKCFKLELSYNVRE